MSPNSQQPLNGLLESLRKRLMQCQNRGRQLTPPNLVVTTQNYTSPLEEISYLLDHLPSQHVLSSPPPYQQGQVARGLSGRP